MADNVIDTLSIQINSSSKGVKSSVDSVINNLTRLEGYLNKFSSSTSGFASAVDSISVGLEKLNVTIGKMDVKGLERTSAALSSLSSSAKKLNGAFGDTGMDKAAQGARNLDAEMNKVINTLMKMNNTSNSVRDVVAMDFEKIMNNVKIDGSQMKFTSAAQEALRSMYHTMEDYSRVEGGKSAEEWSNSFLGYLRSRKGSTIKIPFSSEEIAPEFNEVKRQLAEVFGVGGWTFDTGKATSGIIDFVRDMNSAIGTTFDLNQNEADLFNDIYQAVQQAKAGMLDFSGSTRTTYVDFQQLTQNVASAIAHIEQFKQGLNGTTAEINNNPFEKLATGLRSLEGVGTIPDLSGVAALAENIGKLGGKKALAGIANLPSLVNGLSSLNQLGSVNVPDLTGLAELIAVIGRLGGKKGTNATANIQPLIAGMRDLSALSGLSFPTAEISSLATSFSMLGRETTGKAVNNIPQLANAFKQLMQTLSTAPRVNSSVIALANAMAKLSANGAKVGSASRSLDSSLKRMSNSMSGIGAKMKSLAGRVLEFGKHLLLSGNHATNTGGRYETLASKIGLLYAKFWMLLRAVRLLNNVMGVASNLIEVQNVVDTTFGNMSNKIEEFSKNAIKDFGMSELSAKQYASQFQAMGTAMGITGQQVQKAQQLLNTRRTMEGAVAGYNKLSNSMADMSINLTKLSADMASFYDIEQSTVAKALQSGVMAGQTRPLRAYGLDLTEATLKEWALKNGLDANIKSMTQAEKTMLRYQYVMANSARAQGDFARTSGRMCAA